MSSFSSFTLFAFLLTVRTENEDFQDYNTQQTRFTTDTIKWFSKKEKENTTSHSTTATSTEETSKHTTVAVSAKFPGTVMFHTTSVPPYGRTQITEASAIIPSASRAGFVSRNGTDSHMPTKAGLSEVRSHTESELPLISDSERIVFSPIQAVLESMINGTSEPQVLSPTVAVRASVWLHTLLDKNKRSTDSIALTSADRGVGVPALSAAHPRVTDNLAELHNINDDKRSQGKVEKGILKLERKEYPFGTMQLIPQRDSAEGSVTGTILTNLCLTCLKDQGAASTEKTAALPVLLSEGSSGLLSSEGLTLDFSQHATSSPSLFQQSIGEQDETMKREIFYGTKHPNLSVNDLERLAYNLTYPILPSDETGNYSQSILNGSLANIFFSDTGAVQLETKSLSEMPSLTQPEMKRPSRHTHSSQSFVTDSPTPTKGLYHFAKFYTVSNSLKDRGQDMFSTTANIRSPQSNVTFLSKSKIDSADIQDSFSLKLQNPLGEKQALDISSASVSDKPILLKTPLSNQKSPLPEGSDHSDSTAAVGLIEAHSPTTSFSLRRLSTSTFEHPVSLRLTGRATSLMSELSGVGQLPVKPRSQPTEPLPTLLPEGFGTHLASVTAVRHIAERQHFQTAYTTVNNTAKQILSSVDFLGPMTPIVKAQNSQSPTAKKPVAPTKLLVSELRQDFNNDALVFILTTLSRKSSSEGLTTNRHLGTSQSKIIQGKTSHNSTDDRVLPSHQTFAHDSEDVITKSVHNSELGDQNELEMTLVAGDEETQIIRREGKEGEEIKELKEIQMEEEGQQTRNDEKLEREINREELFRAEKAEGSREEKAITTEVEINQNTDREEDRREEQKAKTRKEEDEVRETTGGEVTIMRQETDLRKETEVRAKEGTKREELTKISEDVPSKDNDNVHKVNDQELRFEKQTQFVTEGGEQARREETTSREDVQHTKETGREDTTNATMHGRHSVFLGLTTNSKELNRDKEQTLTSTPSCHNLMKQLGATEHKSVHLGENAVQVEELKNRSVLREVTSNNGPIQPLITQSPELSRTVSLPKDPYTGFRLSVSAHGAISTNHGVTSSLKKQSTLNKVAEVTFTMTAIPKTVQKASLSSEFTDTLKPIISPHLTATIKSTLSVFNSAGKLDSLTTPQLAISSRLSSAQPHFTVNTSIFNTSVIHHILDQRHPFSTLVSKANTLSQTTTLISAAEQVEHNIPAQIIKSKSSTEDRVSTEITEEINLSFSLDPTPPLQLYNDSPTAEALSSHAHISMNLLQHPHQGQSALQATQSTPSFTMSQGQPRSFTRTGKTAHSDALPASLDNSELKSLQAAMSPKAISDQFPLSSLPPLPFLTLFGGDSLAGTDNLRELTKSASEEGTAKAEESPHSTSEYTDVKSGRVGSKANTHMAEKHENSISTFTTQTISTTENHPHDVAEFESLIIPNGGESFAIKTTDESNQDNLSNVDGSNEISSTVKTTRTNTVSHNNLTQVESNNETSSRPILFTIQTTRKTDHTINEKFVPHKNDFVISLFDRNDGSTAVAESASLSKTEPADVTNNGLFNLEIHAPNSPSTAQVIVGNSALPATQTNFGNDLKDHNISAQEIAKGIVNVLSEVQITTVKASHPVSLAPSANISDLTISTEPNESAEDTSDRQAVFKHSFQTANRAEPTVHSNNHIEPFSSREPLSTPTTGNLHPTVKRSTTTETQSVKEPDHEISIQTIEQTQHALPGMLTTTRPISDPEQGNQAGMSKLKATHRAGGPHDVTYTMSKGAKYSLEVTTTKTTNRAFEASHALSGGTDAMHKMDNADPHERHILSERTSTARTTLGVVTDNVMHTGILTTYIITKIRCRTAGCAMSGETTRTTQTPSRAGETDHAAPKEIHTTDPVVSEHTPNTKPANRNTSNDRFKHGKTTTWTANFDHSVVRKITSRGITKANHVISGETTNTNINSGITTEKHRAVVGRLGILEKAQFIEKITQTQDTPATEVTLFEPKATITQTSQNNIDHTALGKTITKTQLNSGATRDKIFGAHNATRSVSAVARGEIASQDFGRRLLILEPESGPELLRLKPRRRASPDLYLSGVTEVSDDLCGSGNYTAEMSLELGRGLEPGDAVPALGNLRVVINLKTNNSLVNLEVTSCCLSPTIQPDLSSSTCCLFSRLAAEPAGIRLLPSTLSTSASFTISLFQMINYSVVYLHCDLSVCLQNHSDCQRCLQQRSAFPLEDPEAIVTNLRNRISFGPMLKEVKNSTLPEEIDPSALDLVVVILGFTAGCSALSVMLLLVWLAYRRRADWLLQSAAPAQACCTGIGCLHRGGDLILP